MLNKIVFICYELSIELNGKNCKNEEKQSLVGLNLDFYKVAKLNTFLIWWIISGYPSEYTTTDTGVSTCSYTASTTSGKWDNEINLCIFKMSFILDLKKRYYRIYLRISRGFLDKLSIEKWEGRGIKLEN